MSNLCINGVNFVSLNRSVSALLLNSANDTAACFFVFASSILLFAVSSFSLSSSALFCACCASTLISSAVLVGVLEGSGGGAYLFDQKVVFQTLYIKHYKKN
jgi:hypothetical protein